MDSPGEPPLLRRRWESALDAVAHSLRYPWVVERFS